MAGREDEQGAGLGPRGNCVCLKCGHQTAHRPGVPCREERCPKCGTAMLREGSPHHVQALERKARRAEKKKNKS